MSLLLETTIKVSLVVLVALAANGLLRGRSAALRHWMLAAALSCAAAMPVLGVVAPSWQLRVLPAAMTQAGSDADVVVVEEVAVLVAAAGPDRPAADAIAGKVDGSGSRLSPASVAAAGLVPVWLAGVATGVAVLLVGLARLAWLAARAEPVRERAWEAAAADLSRRYGLRRRVILLQSRHPGLLVTWGLFRPKVVLPTSALAWPDERIRVVLGHELAHVRRHDWLVQIAVQLLRSVYWFNPLVWIAGRRLRQESEQACDDAVLNMGVDGRAYAEHLLALARAFRSERYMWSPAPAIARPSSLERRVRAMLNARTNREPVTRAACVAAFAALLAIAVPVAGLDGLAQSFSTLSGVVSDPQGGHMPNVTMLLTNTRSGAKYEVRSDQTGRFEFVGLPAGDYNLEAKLPGFRTRELALAVTGGNLVQDLTLQVGELEETITVTRGSGPEAPPRAAPVDEGGRDRFLRALAECTPSPSGGRIRPPLKIRNVPPQYPEGLREAGIGGLVNLRARIGTDGRTTVVQPVPNQTVDPGLVSSAIDAVSQWEFTGTLLNCVPVEVDMKVSVWFNAQR